ncbi:MAG: DNA translocase FtsK 4TM domain-containing protein [Lachnospiraceae bacterium]|nr:DNA translocase FtsK 4TM domain-containing protein [Dorea sp.]MEE0737311.1 DNA translocase FtsK 4TM domain-containing protein [Lachnospiraceae bacterium]
MAAKSKRKSSRKPTKKKKTEQSFLQDEVIIWLTLAVSLLLMLSNFGLGGWIGDEVSYFFSGIFGLITYIIPFALFGIAAFLVSNKGNVSAYIKVAAGIVFLILACTFLELVDHKGGSLGKSIAKILTPTIGTAGTYVVIIIFMIICCVIITGKSLLQGVKTQSGKAYDKAKEDNARRRKEAELRRKEREQEKKKNTGNSEKEKKKRTDKHAVGVSFATTLTGKSPDMKEIAPEPAKEPVPEPEESPSFVINRAEPAPDVEEAEPFAEEPYEPVRESKKKSGAMAAAEMERVAAAVAADEAKPKKAYHFPPMNLLKRGNKTSGESDAHLRETAMKLQQILQNFGVSVTVTNVSCGPAVTRYELQPEMGVKVSKIVGLTDDIKLNLAAADIRIEAPIPGKAAVGIEVPNKENSAVMLRDLLETAEFKNSQSKISFAAGKDIAGKVVVADIAKMPHLLIAGATGSGKSVCINTLIMSILYKASPEEVKLIMIDPKVVELSVYNGIPHLMIPVVTDPKKAAGALNWAVAEMMRRYQAFAEQNVRDMKGYNEKAASSPSIDGEELKIMPQIVIIVDELADLMMVAPGDVEEAICRLAQLARAAGIHLVVATQRPSVNVITGLIKANMPSRIAFSVSSGVDSRTIIDMNGAEKLLGKGDMLFYPSGYQKPARVQGAFVTDKEVQSVVEYLKNHNGDADYDNEIVQHVNTSEIGTGQGLGAGSEENERDMYFTEAGRLIIDKDKASIGMLQRTFKIGFNRAARIMDQLCEAGVVGGEEGTKPRKVLMSKEEFEQYMSENS